MQEENKHRKITLRHKSQQDLFWPTFQSNDNKNKNKPMGPNYFSSHLHSKENLQLFKFRSVLYSVCPVGVQAVRQMLKWWWSVGPRVLADLASWSCLSVALGSRRDPSSDPVAPILPGCVSFQSWSGSVHSRRALWGLFSQSGSDSTIFQFSWPGLFPFMLRGVLNKRPLRN